MRQVILFIAEYEERLNFFRRFIRCVERNKYTPVFLTDHYSIIVNNRMENIKYVKEKNSNELLECVSMEMLKDTCEYRLKGTNVDDVKRKFYACYETLAELNKEYNIKYIFLWNGMTVMGRSAKLYASINNIEIRFFELSNIPGKTFVDSSGVNKESNLFKNPSDIILKTKPDNEYKYNAWKERYLAVKLSPYIIPQARKKEHNGILRLRDMLYDLYGYECKSGSVIYGNMLLKQIIKRIMPKGKKFSDYQKIDFNDNYVFFPMQCQNDTQLLFNSNIDNIMAIEIASQFATMNQCELVIKPHPAEVEKDYIEAVMEKLKARKIDFIISNENTMKLLMHSKMVFTINSTVGLEALIANVPVTFLGYSMYEKFNQDIMRRYVTDYLLNIEMFDNVELSDDDFLKIKNCL